MRAISTTLLLLSLSACGTAQNCSYVKYERKGVDYDVTAKCQVPITTPDPVPVPTK